MKIIVCPDSFKGSLSASEAAAAIARGIRSASSGQIEIAEIPLADGGEGTVDAMVRATGGSIHHAWVHHPLMRLIEASYGVLGDGKTAVVEMAAASGLGLLTDSERNPLVTSTYGTGELLMAAAEKGDCPKRSGWTVPLFRRIIVGIGGSATNDGGAGAMTALGIRFLDADDAELPPGGAALADLARIDASGLRFPVGQIGVEVACDVTNPLCGPNGASAIFGPQKGATPEMVNQLDVALANYARVLQKWGLSQAERVDCPHFCTDIESLPGAGAAGGLGGALAAFLNAGLRSGIDIVLDAVGFDVALDGADLIITGEGKIDEQTASGKAITGVLKRASVRNIPVIALAGSVSGEVSLLGLAGVYGIVQDGVKVEYAMEHAGELLEALAAKVIPRHLQQVS